MTFVRVNVKRFALVAAADTFVDAVAVAGVYFGVRALAGGTAGAVAAAAVAAVIVGVEAYFARKLIKR